MPEVMMRSHKFAEAGKKLCFPGFVSVKYDGVPGGYSKQKLVSRQNKPLPGVQWMHDKLAQHIPDGWVIWGEHWHPDLDFQTISGLCRKDEPWLDGKLIVFNMFDMFNPNATFTERLDKLRPFCADCVVYNGLSFIRRADQYPVRYVDEALAVKEYLHNNWSHAAKFEGCMYHPVDGLYTLNRSWASLKMVDKQTYDLKVVGFIEAVSKTGMPLDMIGTLICEDAVGKKFNVGPGKLKHDERRELLANAAPYMNRIAVVAAKSSTYEGLREPTFQYWHEDKTEPDTI